MSKFNLVVELEDDKECNGCPALTWEENQSYYNCSGVGEVVQYDYSMTALRPDWCPLIPRVEVKLEPTPLTPEEQDEYQKDLKEEADFHRNGNSALGSLFYRNVKKETP